MIDLVSQGLYSSWRLENCWRGAETMVMPSFKATSQGTRVGGTQRCSRVVTRVIYTGAMLRDCSSECVLG